MNWRTGIHQGVAFCPTSVTCRVLQKLVYPLPESGGSHLTINPSFYRFLNRLLEYLPLSPNLDDSTDLLLHLGRSSFVCSRTCFCDDLKLFSNYC